MSFPDIEKAVMQLLEPYGECYLRLAIDWEHRLTNGHVPVIIHIADLGGVGGDEVLRTDRVRIGVYAASRDAGYSTAEQIRAVLLNSPHATEHGVLDRIASETEPVQMPYISDRVLMYQAVYRVDVRPISLRTKESTDA